MSAPQSLSQALVKYEFAGVSCSDGRRGLSLAARHRHRGDHLAVDKPPGSLVTRRPRSEENVRRYGGGGAVDVSDAAYTASHLFRNLRVRPETSAGRRALHLRLRRSLRSVAASFGFHLRRDGFVSRTPLPGQASPLSCCDY